MTVLKDKCRSVSDVDKAVGEQLVKFRHDQEYSQKNVAEYIGISFQQLQKYEKGVNRISAGRLWQLSQFFGVTPNEFYTNIPTRLDVTIDR